MTSRRAFLCALSGGLVAAPLALAQPQPRHRVAWLAQGDRESTMSQFDAVRTGLRQLGYEEGKNLVLDARWADWSIERTEALATELAALHPAVIVTQGGAARFASRLSPPTPVVFIFSGDPVAAGLVATVARPGRHVTGISLLALELVGKRMELIRELLPQVRRIAVLTNPNHAGEPRERAASQAAADRLRVELSYHPAKTPAELDAALTDAAGAHVDAMVVFPDALMFRFRDTLATFGLRHRISIVSGWAVFTESGGLASYGPNVLDSYRRSAYFVDRIIKGTSAAELPVELPRTFEMAINRRTARALGLVIPPSLLLRADQVIE